MSEGTYGNGLQASVRHKQLAEVRIVKEQELEIMTTLRKAEFRLNSKYYFY